MVGELITFLENLKLNPKISSFDEASTKYSIILPILQLLGWDIFNNDEVTPEFPVEGGRVDFSLRLKHSNEVFIEVKRIGIDLNDYEKQLLDYSFKHGVELASLTNGITWQFYLPTRKGDWKTRRFYTIDIVEQESNDVASKFVDLLSKNNLQSGKAMQHAESIYKGRQRKQAIGNNLPEAWNKIITEPDTSLINLIAETTEKLCGFKPVNEEVKMFLKNHKPAIFISLEQDEKELPQDRRIRIIKEVTQQPERGGKKNKRLRVTINWNEVRESMSPEIICERKAVDTFVALIKRLIEVYGDQILQKLSSLKVSRGYLVTRKKLPKYNYSELMGWYILTNNSTLEKQAILSDVLTHLKLPGNLFRVEVID
jgi:hypothetical protein